MTRDIEETVLPGVGVRFSFVSEDGERVSVLHHHSGRREVFVGRRDDPDASKQLLDLDESDSMTLSELLGGSRVIEDLGKVRQMVRDVALDWVPITEDSPAAGETIVDLDIRSRTGVVVVAVMREGDVLPAPGPDFRFQADDTVVIAGSADSCSAAQDLLRGS